MDNPVRAPLQFEIYCQHEVRPCHREYKVLRDELASINITVGIAVRSIFLVEDIVQLEDQVGLLYRRCMDGIHCPKVLYIIPIQPAVLFLCVVQVFLTDIFTQQA